MNITDKELLAICNLSNLHMEFANLKKEESDIDISEGDSGKKDEVNHTIYLNFRN